MRVGSGECALTSNASAAVLVQKKVEDWGSDRVWIQSSGWGFMLRVWGHGIRALGLVFGFSFVVEACFVLDTVYFTSSARAEAWKPRTCRTPISPEDRKPLRECRPACRCVQIRVVGRFNKLWKLDLAASMTRVLVLGARL